MALLQLVFAFSFYGHCLSIKLEWSFSNKYILVGPDTTDWITASVYCQTTFNTYLASIHSDSDNTEVYNLCQSLPSNIACFIGLNDLHNQETFSWTDNTTLDYGPQWQISQPNVNGPTCGVMVNNGKWSDTPCNSTEPYQQHPFICNAPTTLPIHILSQNENYVWIGPTKMNWNDANDYCKTQFSTQLASIHSAEQNTEIMDLLSLTQGRDAWIGYNDIDIEGTYAWIDGTTTQYGPNWYPPQPDGGDAHDHVAITDPEYHAYNGSWFDAPQYDTYTVLCNNKRVFVEAFSRGPDQCGGLAYYYGAPEYALFQIDDVNVSTLGTGPVWLRGHNIVVLNEFTAEIIDKINFDTHPNLGQNDNITSYLNSIDIGRIVLIAVLDSAENAPSATNVLQQWGCDVSDLLYREAFVFVGTAGSDTPFWQFCKKTERFACPIFEQRFVPLSMDIKYADCKDVWDQRHIHTSTQLNSTQPWLRHGSRNTEHDLFICLIKH
eukprot:533606_1